MKTILGYVIFAETDDSLHKYLGIDGGYYYWSNSLRSANVYATADDCVETLKSKEFTKRNNYTDGSSAPPQMIWTGAGICNTKPKGLLTVSIVPLCLGKTVKSIRFEDELISN